MPTTFVNVTVKRQHMFLMVIFAIAIITVVTTLQNNSIKDAADKQRYDESVMIHAGFDQVYSALETCKELDQENPTKSTACSLSPAIFLQCMSGRMHTAADYNGCLKDLKYDMCLYQDLEPGKTVKDCQSSVEAWYDSSKNVMPVAVMVTSGYPK